MSRMRLTRTGDNEYRIEGLDRDTLGSVAKVLKWYITRAKKKGYFGYPFDRFLDLIATKNLERMRVKKDQDAAK